MLSGMGFSADNRVLERSLEVLRQHTHMDMVFGGPVRRLSVAMQITALNGARTRSPMNLVVSKGEGLGGKALVIGRPVMVADYFTADGITHIYDHAVRPEALHTLAAVPIIVERVQRLVIYLGARAQVDLGARWFDSLMPLVRRIERDLMVEDEVRRRLAVVRPSPRGKVSLTDIELREIAAELAELACLADDDVLRSRIEAVRTRFAPDSTPARTAVPLAVLRPREVDVLRQIAQGCSNRDAGEALGLLPNTVKSYLKNAMRTLQVTNRVQAITAAREQGLI